MVIRRRPRGGDGKHHHEQLREVLHVDSLIPAKAGRPIDWPPTGEYQRRMATDFDHDIYAQRWQVATVMFMLKNHLGDAVAARTEATRGDELALKAATHNVTIVYG